MTPAPPRLLCEDEIRRSVRIDDAALRAVEGAFTRLARGEAVLPPPIGIDLPERRAEVHIKTAYVHGLPGFAVKIASGFYDNPDRGLPSASGMMVLLSAETGHPLALLLDNGYLTDVRTALAGALAARHLAPRHAPTVGVLGTGLQARLQVEALRLVREVRRVVVWGRRPEAVEAYAADVRERLGLEVAAAPSPGAVVSQCDVVVTATASRAPLVAAGDLHEALLVIAVGSDGPGKQELDPRALLRADRVVCDSIAQCARLGELQHAIPLGLTPGDPKLAELGELTAGLKPGRAGEGEVIVADLTGVGVQDTAIAQLAWEEAGRRGLGTALGFLPRPHSE